jgi:hypothetical protein
MKEITDEEYEEYKKLMSKTKRRCDICKVEISYSNYYTHLKSKKHTRNLNLCDLKKQIEKIN